MMAFMMSAGVSASTPWKKGAFETKKYRNLLVEMGYGKSYKTVQYNTKAEGIYM